MSGLIQRTCTQCGKDLQIPAELDSFSCVYCGARMHTPAPSGEGEAAAAYYREQILTTVSQHTNMERFVTKSEFVEAFDAYQTATAEIFRRLDIAVACGSLTVEAAAAEFLQQLEPRWGGKKNRQEADKFTIAVFLVPMVRRLALPCSEDYCRALNALWLQRYPKSPFSIGDYDTIVNGFRKKYLGLCFITTAVCLDSGKPDDCPELTAFRAFRDGYLLQCEDGPALIREYYAIAPQIVARIALSEDPGRRYAQIRTEELEPCYADLLAGKLESCKQRYVAMVRRLQQEYLS